MLTLAGWGNCTFENGRAVCIREGGATSPWNVLDYRKEQRDFFYPIVEALYSGGGW
jgi:hypothetical protein